MSEFGGLWKYEHNQHALVPPKTECGCSSGGGIKENPATYAYTPPMEGTQKEKKKIVVVQICGALTGQGQFHRRRHWASCRDPRSARTPCRWPASSGPAGRWAAPASTCRSGWRRPETRPSTSTPCADPSPWRPDRYRLFPLGWSLKTAPRKKSCKNKLK